MGGTYDPPVRGLGFQPFQGGEEVSSAISPVSLNAMARNMIGWFIAS
jgi:hypothetical protein